MTLTADKSGNAFLDLVPEPAARRSGALAGLRFGAKDLFDVADRAPSCGLATPPYPSSGRTATVIARMQAEGGVLAGFTTMTALAFEPSGSNPVQGRPGNPLSAAHVCGGSSSGSAVAVAAGLVPLAIGTDTAGSLRIPGQCCGVAAWKPTFGLIPTDGAMSLAPSLDTIGFLASTAALLRRVAPVFDDAVPPAIRSVALAKDVLAGCDHAVARAACAAAATLRAIRRTILRTEAEPLIAACDGPVLTVLQAEAALQHRALIEHSDLDPTLRARLAKGLAVPAAALEESRIALRHLAGDPLEALFAGADAVMLPVMRMSTPRVDACEPGSPHFSARTLYALSALTRWVNGLGLPAVAIVTGRDEAGLPVSMQLVGRPGSDRALLDLAVAFETAPETGCSPVAQ